MIQASVIITSYNYARYLPAAIDSALAQRGANVEVVVVDDGSTDQSPAVVRSYENRITATFKSNGGQASAMNAGFAASSADVVIFLDSDDMLLPHAVRNFACLFDDPSVVKVHWPMRVIDGQGMQTGRIVPQQALADGDLRAAILKDGPEAYEWPPTSGNAWRRSFLQRVLPMPEQPYRVCPDVYLAALIPMFGVIRRIDAPQSLWRAHHGNNTWNQPFQTRLPRFIQQWDLACDALARHCQAEGLTAARDRWKRNAWCHRVGRAVERICAIIPSGQTFVLIDGNDWGAGRDFFLRRCLPFPQRDGTYWGPPAHDHAAINELEQHRATGAAFCVLAWPCFWWQEHYPGFVRHVREDYRLIHEDGDLMIFDLRQPST